MRWKRNAHGRFCLVALVMVGPIAIGQTAPGAGSPHAAPQVTGRLVGIRGTQQLILEYQRAGAKGTFFGTIESGCTIPAGPGSLETRPLELSSLPKGSQLTLYYVRHETKGVGTYKKENVVLGIRVEQVAGNAPIHQGQVIPCYKGMQPALPVQR